MTVSVNDIGNSIPAVLLQGADGTLFAVDGKATTTEISPQSYADALQASVNLLDTTKVTGNCYSFVGPGDQKGASSVAEVFFTKKATIPAAKLVADSWVEISGAVLVDSADTTPTCDVKCYIGSLLLETGAIATAAANDYVVFKSKVRVKSVGVGSTVLEVTAGGGSVKDATVTNTDTTLVVGAAGPDAAAAIDVRCSVQFGASHANNKCTIKDLTVTFFKA